MNLRNYREQLKSNTDYFPSNSDYQDEMDDIINNSYFEVWNAMRWNFSQKTIFIPFFPDITSSRAADVTASITRFQRNVVFSAAVTALQGGTPWEGQVIELDGIEYKILKMESQTELRLAKPYRGETLAADTDWVIKHKFYYLPEDAQELLNLSHRDAPIVDSGLVGGKQINISNFMEERANLDLDKTSTYADYYVNLSPIVIPPGEKTGLEAEEVAIPAASIPDAYNLEVCWAYITEGGRVGPLSEPEEVVTGTAEQNNAWQINVSFLTHDDQDVQAPTYLPATDTYTNQFEGLRKVIFFNQNYNHTTGVRLGRPCWRAVTKYGITPSQDEHLAVVADDVDKEETIYFQEQISAGNPRYIENDGQHLRIRPYPRIDGWDVYNEYTAGPPIAPEERLSYGQMRYIYKPQKLCASTDTPEMPYEFHQLILYQALKDLYLKHSNLQLSGMYSARLDAEIKKLKQRYTARRDVNLQKRAISYNDENLVWYNAVDITHLT